MARPCPCCRRLAFMTVYDTRVNDQVKMSPESARAYRPRHMTEQAKIRLRPTREVACRRRFRRAARTASS